VVGTVGESVVCAPFSVNGKILTLYFDTEFLCRFLYRKFRFEVLGPEAIDGADGTKINLSCFRKNTGVHAPAVASEFTVELPVMIDTGPWRY
jgi:hypothetical protein